MKNWKFESGVGISTDSVQVHLGMDQEQLRDVLGYSTEEYHRMSSDTDFYRNALNTGACLKLHFDQGELEAIDFFDGSLKFGELELMNTTLPVLLPALAEMGYECEYADYKGLDCSALGINIGSAEDIGSEGDHVGWIHISNEI